MKPLHFTKTPHFPPHTGALPIVSRVEDEISQSSWQDPRGFAGIQGRAGGKLPSLHNFWDNSATLCILQKEFKVDGSASSGPTSSRPLRDSLRGAQSPHGNCCGSKGFWQLMETTRTLVRELLWEAVSLSFWLSQQ